MDNSVVGAAIDVGGTGAGCGAGWGVGGTRLNEYNHNKIISSFDFTTHVIICNILEILGSILGSIGKEKKEITQTYSDSLSSVTK